MAVTPDQLTAGLNPHLEGTAEQLRFRDRFGITYEGEHASHVVLEALRRIDVTNELPLRRPERNAVRIAASFATTWLSCLHTRDAHRRRLAALTPERVCRMVARLATALLKGLGGRFVHVGPATLALYSEYVLALADADSDAELPPVPTDVEQPPDWLGETQPLDVTPTGPGGAEAVTVHIEVTAVQTLFWDFTAALPYPVAQIHRIMCGDTSYLTENPDLLKVYLHPDKATEINPPELTVQILDPPPPDRTRRLRPECRCVVSCADEPATMCSLSGVPHVHPDSGNDTFGRCPEHPDAPGDL